MKPFLVAPMALVATSLFASSATASTLPSMDFQKGQTTVAIGLTDVSLDYALRDGLSIGISGAYVLPAALMLAPGTVGAARVTQHLTRIYNLDVGMTLSVGYGAFTIPGPDFSNRWAKWWWQPALNFALIKAPPFERWTPRITLGPVLWLDQQPAGSDSWLPLPNIELGYRLDQRNELTLGGNSLFGWRMVI
jgi:hypothetical protein